MIFSVSSWSIKFISNICFCHPIWVKRWMTCPLLLFKKHDKVNLWLLNQTRGDNFSSAKTGNSGNGKLFVNNEKCRALFYFPFPKHPNSLQKDFQFFLYFWPTVTSQVFKDLQASIRIPNIEKCEFHCSFWRSSWNCWSGWFWKNNFIGSPDKWSRRRYWWNRDVG